MGVSVTHSFYLGAMRLKENKELDKVSDLELNLAHLNQQAIGLISIQMAFHRFF